MRPASDYVQMELDLSPHELAIRKVGANAHISFGGAYYSAPIAYYNKMVFVRATRYAVDILDGNGRRIASHNRTFTKHKYVTDRSHLPALYYSVFLDDGRYDGAKIRAWAAYFGPYTSQLIDALLERKAIEEHAYKSCIAVIQLSKKYGTSILERTCMIALASDVFNFYEIHKIAKAEYDKLNKYPV